MTGSTVAGLIVVKNPRPTRVHPPGKLPASVCRHWRQLVLKALCVSGDFTAPQINQILGTPERTVRRDISKRGKKNKATGGGEEAPDEDLRCDQAGDDGRSKPLTADEIREIRKAYADTDDPAVKAFLDAISDESGDE